MTGRRHQISPAGTPPSDDESGATRIDISSKDQDRFLPIANVSRIMKKSLPANAKISKEAKEIVQECVSEFISFVTGEASDKCQREKRKTINGDDLLWSMTTLGFENYVEPLKVYLSKFREIEEEKSSMARHGDQFAKEECGSNTSNSFNHGVNTNNESLTSFYGGFYPLVTPVIPPSFDGGGERVIAYGEHLQRGASQIRVYGNGGRNV